MNLLDALQCLLAKGTKEKKKARTYKYPDSYDLILLLALLERKHLINHELNKLQSLIYVVVLCQQCLLTLT